MLNYKVRMRLMYDERKYVYSMLNKINAHILLLDNAARMRLYAKLLKKKKRECKKKRNGILVVSPHKFNAEEYFIVNIDLYMELVYAWVLC